MFEWACRSECNIGQQDHGCVLCYFNKAFRCQELCFGHLLVTPESISHSLFICQTDGNPLHYQSSYFKLYLLLSQGWRLSEWDCGSGLPGGSRCREPAYKEISYVQLCEAGWEASIQSLMKGGDHLIHALHNYVQVSWQNVKHRRSRNMASRPHWEVTFYQCIIPISPYVTCHQQPDKQFALGWCACAFKRA